jgi:sugar lactone lactonase YvrE
VKIVRAAAGLLGLSALCLLSPGVSWSQLGGQFEFPISVAVDSAGNVYVSERDRHRINKIDGNTGAVIWRTGTQGAGPDQFYAPAGIAIDSAGSIFVADTYNARIQKLAPNGAPVSRWGSYGSGDGQFVRPHAIAIDALGNLYVVDSPLRRVQKFSNAGAYRGKFGSAGPGPNQFSAIGGGPRDIVIDASNDIYIADTGANRVQKWRPFSDTAGQLTRADFLGWMGRCTSGKDCDTAHEKSGDRLCDSPTPGPGPGPSCSASSPGTGPGQFQNPFGLALDGQGRLFVADFDNNRIQRFVLTGGLPTAWGTLGTGPGQFRGPIDVAAFGTTAVYVADMRNKRISKFGNNGQNVSTIGGDIFLSAAPGWPPDDRNALIDPNPFFVLTDQTATSQLTVASLAGFQGNVTLNRLCCQDLLTGAPITPVLPTGVDVTVSPGPPSSLNLAANSSIGGTMTVRANSSATGGKYLALVTAGNQPSSVSRQIGVSFEVVPLRADSTTRPCPGFYQQGSTPEVLPLRSALTMIYGAKAAAPTKVSFALAVAFATVPRVGLEITIDKANTPTPLRSNESLVLVDNPTRSMKAVTAIDGRACGVVGTAGFVAQPGGTGMFRISTANTTTLVFSQQGQGQDIAVFAEQNFWALAGGRRLTIQWMER